MEHNNNQNVYVKETFQLLFNHKIVGILDFMICWLVNTYIYNKVFNEYLGEREMLYNPNFNCTEFDTIKKSNFVNTYI